jgi:epoxyqueuosine reductase
MKKALQKFCSSLNIEYMGIAPAGPYIKLQEILKDRINKGQYTEFEEKDIQKRIDPRVTMESVQSVIVCLFPYYVGERADSNIAKYTYSMDYHQVVKAKLEEIGEFLESRIQGFHYKAFVDNGPLVDRYMAHLAGLGFYGLNSHIITEKYGSYVFIGYMLVNYPFEADKPLDRTCIQCRNCMNACPGKIILGNFAIDPRFCRSYLTQKKGDLSKEEVQILKKTNVIFGCDVCQDVCPHNSQIELTMISEFQEDPIYQVSYDEIVSISNKEFRRRYGNRAFSWRGRRLIERNYLKQ